MEDRSATRPGRARLAPALGLLLVASATLSSGCALLEGLASLPRPAGDPAARDPSEEPATGLGPPGPGTIRIPRIPLGITGPGPGAGAGNLGGGYCYQLSSERLPTRDHPR